MKYLKNLRANTTLRIATGAAMLAAHNLVFAAGGLDAVKTEAETIKTGLYAAVGVVAIIYLIWIGVMAFAEKKSWADFGWAVIYVSLVGAATAIGSWAWGLFA